MLIPRSIRRTSLAWAGVGLALGVWPIVADAILVAPTAVFIDHRVRTGELHLVNRGTVPEEVSVELRFGYPDADSGGNAYIHFFDSLPAGAPSAAGWVRAFPRRVVVPADGQQLVRLLASPPADLPDGEYWSRIIVTARQAAPSVLQADSGMRAQINVEVRTIIALLYRKGAVRTGLVLNDFRAGFEHDSLVVWMDLARTGDAAYLGTARVSLRDPRDASAAGEWDTQLAVYTPMRRRLAFPVADLRPGAYAVGLSITTARQDIDQRSVLPAAPVERTMTVEFPGP
jgi:hypothetical protein